jgi:endonuclease VIII
MPEGDAVHRAARRLQPLVGQEVEVEAPHPRAAATGVAERVNGRTLTSVEAVGKNLLLTFDGRVVLRSHLRMSGRWTVVPRGSARRGRPWLVVRGAEREAVLWNGPVLELHARSVRRLGPDVLASEPEVGRMLANLRGEPAARAVGDALLDQRLVAGIGNKWKAEALWAAAVSPWRPLGGATDEELRAVLETAVASMRRSLDGARSRNRVYRRVGRPCPRCGATIASRGQGDDNRVAYWCPGCQL